MKWLLSVSLLFGLAVVISRINPLIVQSRTCAQFARTWHLDCTQKGYDPDACRPGERWLYDYCMKRIDHR